jgi:hypothetical protein
LEEFSEWSDMFRIQDNIDFFLRFSKESVYIGFSTGYMSSCTKVESSGEFAFFEISPGYPEFSFGILDEE